jgi:di/tricarboxylate transporter
MTNLNTSVQIILDKIISFIVLYATQICGIFILIAVVTMGFEIIQHRKDSNKIKEAFKSLIWLVVGAFIIGSAITISGIIMGVIKL